MVEYAASFPDTGYSLDLVSLGGAVGGCAAGTIATTGAACLIDPTLSAGSKSGYLFTAAGAATGGSLVNNTYTVTAVPQGIGSTGNRGFYSDQSGVISYSLDGSAPSAGSSPLQ
jgi:hypothetical protein